MTQESNIDAMARVITLSNALPVRIHDEEWPVIGSARWSVGMLEYKARRGWMFVRKHVTDGRLIVYGGLDTTWASERDLRAGEIVGAGASSTELVDAIMRVARQLRATDATARDLIARLPPVEI